jgi:hypothetical protein
MQCRAVRLNLHEEATNPVRLYGQTNGLVALVDDHLASKQASTGETTDLPKINKPKKWIKKNPNNVNNSL